MNNWSNTTHRIIKDLEKKILKKKIMLNFIVDQYAWWDKAYRYLQLFIAIVTPIFGIIESLTESSEGTRVISIVMSCIVAVLIKFKDFINYDKIHDSAKKQTIKYSQLYTKINREKSKPAHKRQEEADFLYIINKEYDIIEINDPEMTLDDKVKFKNLCKELNIPHDEDLDTLLILLRNSPAVNKSTRTLDKHNTTDINNENTTNPTNNDITSTEDDIKISIAPLESPLTESLEKSALGSLEKSSTPTNRRQSYNMLLKRMNTQADMKWAIERLGNLD